MKLSSLFSLYGYGVDRIIIFLGRFNAPKVFSRMVAHIGTYRLESGPLVTDSDLPASGCRSLGRL